MAEVAYRAAADSGILVGGSGGSLEYGKLKRLAKASNPGGRKTARLGSTVGVGVIQVAPQMRILVAIESVDLRKGIDGLAQLCRKSWVPILSPAKLPQVRNLPTRLPKLCHDRTRVRHERREGRRSPE
jgi:hypothetical protein